jgi:hypothetical protein
VIQKPGSWNLGFLYHFKTETRKVKNMNNKWMRILAALAAVLGLTAITAACTSNSEDDPGGQPPASEAAVSESPSEVEQPVVEEAVCAEQDAELGWDLPSWNSNSCGFVLDSFSLLMDGAVAAGFNTDTSVWVSSVSTGNPVACDGVEMVGGEIWYTTWCSTEGQVLVNDELIAADMSQPEVYYHAIFGSALYSYVDYLFDYNVIAWSESAAACIAGGVMAEIVEQAIATEQILGYDEALYVGELYFPEEISTYELSLYGGEC